MVSSGRTVEAATLPILYRIKPYLFSIIAHFLHIGSNTPVIYPYYVRSPTQYLANCHALRPLRDALCNAQRSASGSKPRLLSPK